jgi:hypothetical protein
MNKIFALLKSATGFLGKESGNFIKLGKHSRNMVLFNAVFAVPTILNKNLSPGEKLKRLGTDALVFSLTSGMKSGVAQLLWTTGLFMAPAMPGLMRGMVHGYRGSLEARTSAAVPFSHSTMPMDQAYATLSYARSRMSEAFEGIGSEASWMAARFMTRT